MIFEFRQGSFFISALFLVSQYYSFILDLLHKSHFYLVQIFNYFVHRLGVHCMYSVLLTFPNLSYGMVDRCWNKHRHQVHLFEQHCFSKVKRKSSTPMTLNLRNSTVYEVFYFIAAIQNSKSAHHEKPHSSCSCTVLVNVYFLFH